MDIHFERNGITFVWNSKKAIINKNKHDGITFEQATHAFFDPFFKLVDAQRNDESRDAVLGYDKQGRLLFVVHIEIENELIRIISARKATSTERNEYDF
jgi:uncharacterized DUF497 family protein